MVLDQLKKAPLESSQRRDLLQVKSGEIYVVVLFRCARFVILKLNLLITQVPIHNIFSSNLQIEVRIWFMVLFRICLAPVVFKNRSKSYLGALTPPEKYVRVVLIFPPLHLPRHLDRFTTPSFPDYSCAPFSTATRTCTCVPSNRTDCHRNCRKQHKLHARPPHHSVPLL